MRGGGTHPFLVLDVSRTRRGSIHWLVCIYSGLNVTILWRLIKIVYAKLTIVCLDWGWSLPECLSSSTILVDGTDLSVIFQMRHFGGKCPPYFILESPFSHRILGRNSHQIAFFTTLSCFLIPMQSSLIQQFPLADNRAVTYTMQRTIP